MFEAMEALVGFQLVLEREIKVRRDSRICLVRDQRNLRYIYREFTGSDRVYRRLQPVMCLGLPRIYGVLQSGETVKVLEEYIQGDTLAGILEKGCLNERQAEQILRQLCTALMQLHNMGIVHRDIKPENVILRGDQAVLIDFHASRLENPLHDTDTRILGTSGYAAPEQYGFAQTDARADLYALGVLTNEMLTGCHPSSRLAAGKLRPIIEKCIEVNVDKRYSSAAELVLSLEAGDQNKSLRRWKAATAAAWVVALAALILAVWKPQAPVAPEREPAMLEETTEPTETTPPEETTVETTAPTEPSEEEYEPGGLNVRIHSGVDVAVPDKPWPGDAVGFLTDFTCDLDRDGVSENYVFGLEYAGIPVNGVTHDRSGIPPDSMDSRDVYPCVWRRNEDGTVGDEVGAFTDLLENGKVTLWRVDVLDGPAPTVKTIGIPWSGAVRVTMNANDHLGRWYYEVSAELNGKVLTAGSITERILWLGN